MSGMPLMMLLTGCQLLTGQPDGASGPTFEERLAEMLPFLRPPKPDAAAVEAEEEPREFDVEPERTYNPVRVPKAAEPSDQPFVLKGADGKPIEAGPAALKPSLRGGPNRYD